MMKVELMLALYYEYQAEMYDREIATRILPEHVISYDNFGYVKLITSALSSQSARNAYKLKKEIREIISLLQLDLEQYEAERVSLNRFRFTEVERQYREIEHLVKPIIALYEHMNDWRDISYDRGKSERSNDFKEILYRPTKQD